MKMNKKTVLSLALALIFLIVFNVVFFVLGGAKHPASVWIAYGFIHLAYLLIVATPLLNPKGAQGAILGLPLYAISTGYFLVEFVVGVVFILIAPQSYKGSLLVQLILAGVYAAAMLINMIAIEHTVEATAKQAEEVSYIKETATDLKELMFKASDKDANKAIERAYDAVHASPTKTSPAVQALEQKIVADVRSLRGAVNGDDTEEIIRLGYEIVELTEERIRQLKLEQQQ